MSAEAPTAVTLPPRTDGLLPPQPAARRRLSPKRSWAFSCLFVDVLTLSGAAAGSMIGAREGGIEAHFSGWTIAFCALALALFRSRGLYALPLRIAAVDDVRRILGAITIAATGILTLRLVLSASPAFASETLRPWAFAAAYVSAGRVALYWSQTRSRAGGEALRPTLIVGAGRVGRVVASRLLENPRLGLKPVAFLDDAPLVGEDDRLGLPVLGAVSDLEGLVGLYGVEQLVVTFSNERDETLLGLVNRAEQLGLSVSIVPRLYEKVPERLTVEHLGGIPLITVRPANPHGLEIAVKYALDRLLAGVIFLLVLPLYLAAALAVYLSMGRPIHFRQIRVGRDGRPFEILKFRSMKLPTAAEAEAGRSALAAGSAPGGVEGVDRRTRVGTILRKTSIDELPQLLNVLKGEMSLVGPRPERPEFVSAFEREVYRYGDRHRVKAGITGWAQVHGLRGKTSIADRAEWDNFYVENFSLWLDLKILVLTVGAVLRAVDDVE